MNFPFLERWRRRPDEAPPGVWSDPEGVAELLSECELLRARAERLIALEPWGREQWERLSQGLTFDGMESWLPWLTEGEHVLFDLVGPEALVLLLEPRRMRDRAGDLLAEFGANETGVLVAELDLVAARRHRAAFGFFRDRRPELYGRLVQDI